MCKLIFNPILFLLNRLYWNIFFYFVRCLGNRNVSILCVYCDCRNYTGIFKWHNFFRFLNRKKLLLRTLLWILIVKHILNANHENKKQYKLNKCRCETTKNSFVSGSFRLIHIKGNGMPEDVQRFDIGEHLFLYL